LPKPRKQKKIEKMRFVGVRVPTDVAKAIDMAVETGKAVTPSDYLRDALRLKLREDGLL
jgi:Arc/MetJ-type ribon-helix-helix transcriptional regulator